MATVLFFTVFGPLFPISTICRSGSRQRGLFVAALARANAVGNKKAPSDLERGLAVSLSLEFSRARSAQPRKAWSSSSRSCASSWAGNLERNPKNVKRFSEKLRDKT
jgi:hypothetical protein